MHLEVTNESAMHSVPKGSETHFKVLVVSTAFAGMGPVDRHRTVNGALAFGKDAIALPSAGNAGSAAAAYAAAAGLRCRITMPERTPEAFVLEARGLGAEVRLVPGTIADAGQALAEWAPAPEWWNVATFKEPFRLEGKKTLGYEIAEQSAWDPPRVIFYPAGGGTGLVGMWKAFDELRTLGWMTTPMPRLVAVQVAGCAPIVRAYDAGLEVATPWENAATVASGLRVPAPFADRLILRAVRESGGTAVAVSEAFRIAGHKLPLATKFLVRKEQL